MSETVTEPTVNVMKIEEVTKGITLADLIDAGAKDDFAFTTFQNIQTERESIINIPVVKEDPVAYFLEEGERAELDSPFKCETKTLKLGTIVAPNYMSYQRRLAFFSGEKSRKTTLLTSMTSRLFDKIDEALFSTTDVAKSEIQSIFAHAKSSNAVNITSDINSLYTFVAKLEPYQQKDAYMYMSQVTYNNLVKYLFLSNSNYILNTQDITQSRDLSILGVPVVISSHVPTNKIVYMTTDSYVFGYQNKLGIFEQESSHGNVFEQTLITVVGGIFTDNRNCYIGSIVTA